MQQRIKRIVGFSGGADSQATALWVRQRYEPEDIILLNTDAGGNEHPITTQFLSDYSEKVFAVITIPALVKDLLNLGTKEGATRDRRREFGDDEPLTFDRLAYIKRRFPSRTAQFCTQHLKLEPQLRWIKENLQGVPYERYIGVRRDESERRRLVSIDDWDDYFQCNLHRPLAEWSKQKVFDFLRENGEEVNPLYRMGFGRVGCAPCINSGKADILNWATRFPEMIAKVRGWEAKNGRTFFAPMIPGKEINWVDEVVEWSKTVRGGKQYALPFFEEEAKEGGCLSDYGLCE